MKQVSKFAIPVVCLCALVRAQAPIGTLEGKVTDPAAALVWNAEVSVHNEQTGLTRKVLSSHQGAFHFSDLPVGAYLLEVKAPGFATYSALSIRIDIGLVVSWPVQLRIAGEHTEVSVSGEAVTVDTSPTIGNVVSEKQATDLPLNGRDLTQLGLLQPGVAPMTAGLAEAGGIARSGQAYGVNGQGPESNDYLLDGASNVYSVNGGYALRVPVDAVSEFRILTLNAPAEYGDTSGATTSVVTKSGSNSFHGDVYEFLRNNAMDSRNFFASQTEPLHRNQYGATLGGPIRKDEDFFFLYYEGQRDSEGTTQAAIVPTAAERTGNFSGLADSATGQPTPLINEFTGQPFPGNQIPASIQSPIALVAENLYPLPNIGTNVFESTQLGSTNYDQGGFRLGHNFSASDQLFCALLNVVSTRTRPASHQRSRRARLSGYRRHRHQFRHRFLGSPDFARDRANGARLDLPQCIFQRTGGKPHAGQQPGVSIPAHAGIERRRSVSYSKWLRVTG
ncbi:MAG: carboxypeptidase-like regulatory domain-containing protein [Bryobacteraceae bacterium]